MLCDEPICTFTLSASDISPKNRISNLTQSVIVNISLVADASKVPISSNMINSTNKKELGLAKYSFLHSAVRRSQ